MVMRFGARDGGCYVHICSWTRYTKSQNTQIQVQIHRMQAGMGTHANTGMYINAQIPTLNTEISKLQPESSWGQYYNHCLPAYHHTSTHTSVYTHTHTLTLKGLSGYMAWGKKSLTSGLRATNPPQAKVNSMNTAVRTRSMLPDHLINPIQQQLPPPSQPHNFALQQSILTIHTSIIYSSALVDWTHPRLHDK